MDRQTLISQIESDLGFPVVKVELDDTHWDTLIANAKRWFTARKGLISVFRTPLTDTTEYSLPPDSYEIVDVAFPNSQSITASLNLCFFDIIPVWGYQVGGTWTTPGALRFDSSSYAQLLMALEQRRRVFGAEAGWVVLGDKLYITVQRQNLTGDMIVFYKKKTWDIEELVGRDEDLFYRYSLAKAKAVLGRILRKYGSYPAAGGPIQTDGAELIADSKEEIATLEEEIIGSQGNAGGIVVG